MMKYFLPVLPMLAAMVAHPVVGAPSSLVPRQEDWDGTQTGGIFCELRLNPSWDDCKFSRSCPFFVPVPFSVKIV
jgi:hypothetical protein